MTEGNREVRELPKGWSLVSISDVCLVMSGQTPKGVDSNISSDGEIPWFRVGNMNEPGNERALRFTDIRLTQERANSLGLHVRPENTIVFPKRGGAIATNKKRFLGQPSAYDLNLMGIFPVGFNIQYFWYWFQTVDLKRFSDGSNVPQINHGDIEPLLFPLAPLFEQSRIVEKVEELFSDIDYGIKSLKTAQKQLKVYRQAVLKWAFDGNLTEAWRTQQSTLKTGEALLTQIKAERENRDRQQVAEWEMAVKEWEAIEKVGKKPTKPQKPKELPPFTGAELCELSKLPNEWCAAKIDFICDVVRGASPRPAGNPKYFGGEIPWIVVGDLTKDENTYLTKVTNFVTEEGREQSRFIEPETLLLTNSGATLGVPKIIKIGGCINDGSVAFLNLNENMKLYLYWFLKSQTLKLRGINQGAAQPNLNTTIVGNIVVPVTALEEQEQIVQEIESRLSICDQLEATILENLQKAEALRQSILKQAFEGKLVPQDPNDEPAETLLDRIKAERQVNGNTGKKSKSSHQQLTLQEL